jgi:hypothetical protein
MIEIRRGASDELTCPGNVRGCKTQDFNTLDDLDGLLVLSPGDNHLHVMPSRCELFGKGTGHAAETPVDPPAEILPGKYADAEGRTGRAYRCFDWIHQAMRRSVFF